MKDKEWKVRGDAALALITLGNEQGWNYLITALGDKNNWYIRSITAEVLGEIGDQRAVEPLIAALKDNTWKVRINAMEALGKIGDQRAVEPLIAALKDTDVRGIAAGVLGKIGDQRAVEPLKAVLKDYDKYVRNSALEALEDIDSRK